MSWIWPTLSEYQKEIPAWIRFDAWNYTSNIDRRNDPIETFWNSNQFASVPLPTKIGTDLNMDYTTNSARISTDRNFSISNERVLNPSPGTLFDASKTESPTNIRMPGRDFTKGPQSNNKEDYDSNKSFLDVIDTTWLGQSRRIYAFDINMICKSLSDSRAAASICNYMNAGALPVMESFGRNEVVGNQKAFHPPMWAIHVNDGFDVYTATRMWLGEYPQLCVLQKVNGTRIGGDGNQIIGMGVNGSPLNPIIYNLKLIFVELEPVYTNGNNTIAQSRSQFIQ
jgi:hypothetical protein